MTIADTCFLIDLMKGDISAESVARRDRELKTTAISTAEFLYGARRTGRREVLDTASTFLHFFPVLPFEAEDAVIYGRIASALSESGHRISTLDELIASIALRRREPLLTRDKHFAAIDGLDLVGY